jgi:hypothetical protein
MNSIDVFLLWSSVDGPIVHFYFSVYKGTEVALYCFYLLYFRIYQLFY